MIYYTHNTNIAGFHSPGIPKNKHSPSKGICNITYCSSKAYVYLQIPTSDELSSLQPHKAEVRPVTGLWYLSHLVMYNLPNTNERLRHFALGKTIL